MIAKRWVRGVVGAGALAGVLAACGTPPAPSAAPGPTGPAAGRPSGSARPGATAGSSAGPGSTAGSGPSAGAEAGAECPEGGVRLLEGDGSAAMGLRAESVQLVNCGTEPYALEGYPVLRLLDKAGAPVEATVAHGAAGITTGVPNVEATPRPVVLGPGQAAYMPMVWRNLVTDPTVVATDAWALEITPRPGAPKQRLRLTRPVDLGNTGLLGIGPWQEVPR